MRATVLIPTHDHGTTLRHAAASALEQTIEDLEVFIVGDGASDETREVAQILEKDDERVRFFDNPKGPRHGEVHRHAALQEARGEIVCYLSDDDLWFPEHVSVLAGALVDADVAHPMTARVYADGTIGSFFGNLADPRHRRRLLTEPWNFIPFSAFAHTTAAYRRLPEGWRTSPDDVWTDLHMWRQFLAGPACRAASVPVPTVVHFASSERDGWTPGQRLDEIATVAARLEDPLERARLASEVHEAALQSVQDELRRTGERMDAYRARAEAHAARGERLHQHVLRLDEALAKTRDQRDAVRAHAESMKGSLTWRLRDRLLRNSILARLRRRTAARARSRRAPR